MGACCRSNESCVQFCLGLRDYTLKTYRRLLASCTAKAQAYTDAPADTKPDPWTPYEFEQAIWAYAVLGKPGPKTEDKTRTLLGPAPAPHPHVDQTERCPMLLPLSALGQVPT